MYTHIYMYEAPPVGHEDVVHGADDEVRDLHLGDQGLRLLLLLLLWLSLLLVLCMCLSCVVLCVVLFMLGRFYCTVDIRFGDEGLLEERHVPEAEEREAVVEVDLNMCYIVRLVCLSISVVCDLCVCACCLCCRGRPQYLRAGKCILTVITLKHTHTMYSI